MHWNHRDRVENDVYSVEERDVAAGSACQCVVEREVDERVVGRYDDVVGVVKETGEDGHLEFKGVDCGWDRWVVGDDTSVDGGHVADESFGREVTSETVDADVDEFDEMSVDCVSARCRGNTEATGGDALDHVNGLLGTLM